MSQLEESPDPKQGDLRSDRPEETEGEGVVREGLGEGPLRDGLLGLLLALPRLVAGVQLHGRRPQIGLDKAGGIRELRPGKEISHHPKECPTDLMNGFQLRCVSV